MAKIAIMGFGVVGSGVAEVFYKNKESLERKAATSLDIKYILEIRDIDSPYKDKFTNSFEDILIDPEIKVVVEVMGGIDPAYRYVKRLLEFNKSVVTSNKELVAAKGAELLELARRNNVNFFFEASVGGGIPIIRPLHQCLIANEIDEIAGILNGTTNFILTKMIREQMSFEDALALAQELGYAERDPTADVEGHDSCRKISILASLAFGRQVDTTKVHTEGITNIKLVDVEYAESCDSVIKLVGRAKRRDNGNLIVAVSPAVVSLDNQLGGINDVFNGILVRGDAIGDALFYGKGAGKLPTASAVIADVIDAVRSDRTVPTLYWTQTDDDFIDDYREDELACYYRVRSTGPNAKERIKTVFPGAQFLSRHEPKKGEYAFITPVGREKDITAAMDTLSDCVDIRSFIRVLDY